MKKATLYRFYCGLIDKRGAQVRDAFYIAAMREFADDGLIDGFTVLHSTGYWEKKEEPSLVIEVIELYDEYNKATTLAHCIANVLATVGDQTAVYYTSAQIAMGIGIDTINDDDSIQVRPSARKERKP